MAHSLIVELLAERPESDLRSLREQAVAQRQRIDVEIEQVDEALAKQARRRGTKAAPRAGGGSAAPGTTRQRVLQALRDKGQATPAEIAASFQQEGHPMPSGSIYNMLKALRDKGAIERIADGVYQIASANGSSASEPSTDASSVGQQGTGGQAPRPHNDGLAVATAPRLSGFTS